MLQSILSTLSGYAWGLLKGIPSDILSRRSSIGYRWIILKAILFSMSGYVWVKQQDILSNESSYE